ncbi:MAG: hypothetical protein PF487_14005 [Bacteroidales bacterium]|nr:hypothetical protein [Bacteroidales bacterium]
MNEIEKLSSNISVSTIVEISKKVTELLDNVEYDNKVMLITKEHIKSNLAQLISTTDNELKFKLKNPERSNSNPRNRKSRFKSSKNFSIDNRGKLTTNFSLAIFKISS